MLRSAYHRHYEKHINSYRTFRRQGSMPPSMIRIVRILELIDCGTSSDVGNFFSFYFLPKEYPKKSTIFWVLYVISLILRGSYMIQPEAQGAYSYRDAWASLRPSLPGISWNPMQYMWCAHTHKIRCKVPFFIIFGKSLLDFTYTSPYSSVLLIPQAHEFWETSTIHDSDDNCDCTPTDPSERSHCNDS